MSDDPPIAAGRDADVHRLPDGRVRRSYRDGRSATHEADVLRAVGALGYPVPTVYRASGPDIVMEFVAGPTLTQALVSGMDPTTGGAILADLHHRLHALAWPDAGPGECLLHLDLHPENVLLRDGRPVVIDWTNAGPGAPGLDVAMTALILAQLVVTDSMLASVGLGEEARDAVAEVLHAYGRRVDAPTDDELDDTAMRRHRDRYQTDAERAMLPQAARLAAVATRGRRREPGN